MPKTAIVLYPHQLYEPNTSWFSKAVPIYLIEEPLFLSEFPIHRQKLLLHRLSMKAFEHELIGLGFTVYYEELNKDSSSADIFYKLAKLGFTDLIIPDTTDNWLEKRITASCQKHNLIRHSQESQIFLLPKAEATERYLKSGKHMANFYKKIRLDKKILITTDNEPEGGRFSFDEDNRKKIPKGQPLPEEIALLPNNDDLARAQAWLKTIQTEQYGTDNIWIPYTRHEAAAYMNRFIAERLANFGTYEDALSSHHTRLFHSTLSPLLNIGLITPEQVLSAVLKYSSLNNIGLNNTEGFIRQIIGWREFIRAAYEVDGTTMRNGNFFNHKNKMPAFFWTGHTDITPLKQSLYSTINYGYNHHIERLMVLGNFLLLNRTDPNEAYRWFMTMYVDAYDWVMVPNVYGMSQFADGGIFATKPYIGCGNYLKKMSNYETGAWEDLFTALYWEFIADNSVVFAKNHRLAMMPKLLNKLSPDKRLHYKNVIKNYYQQLSGGSA